MKEQQPQPPEEEQRSWDIEAIGRILDVPEEPSHDVAFGKGTLFRVGQEEQTKTLEVYPESRIARLTGQNAKVELYRLDPPEITERGVIFGRPGESLCLSLSRQGEVVLFMAGAGKSEPTPEEAQIPDDSKQKTESPEQERLTLFGRVGATPSFRTTPKGKLVARFPLAVHGEENRTSWHTVLAFGDRAEKLRDALKKGQAVEIVGYRHTRESRTRDGQPKVVEEIYAVAVKTR